MFISVLTGSGRSAEEIEVLRKLEELVDIGAITIFTAAITLVEVLACKLTMDQENAFKGLLGRSNVLPVSVTARVAERAREIRDHYRRLNLEIAVPDSIHIATALHYKATALHTYDGCGKRPRSTDLLRLERPIIGKYELHISKPELPPELAPDPPLPSDLRTISLFEALEFAGGGAELGNGEESPETDQKQLGSGE